VCAALTAQGREVMGAYPVEASILEQQTRSVGEVAAAKIGMLGSEAVVERVVFMVINGVIPAPVVDPVRHASTGMMLMENQAGERLKHSLLPRAGAVTPNLDEAAWLTGVEDVLTVAQMEDAARALLDAGVGLAVITGGHLEGALVDVGMAAGDDAPWQLLRRRVQGSARGTGCRFSSALATFLALELEPRAAVERAGEYVASYVAMSAGI
jgi:hydroxymethylpyrimidine/phosphomethylpyrimidine kinase